MGKEHHTRDFTFILDESKIPGAVKVEKKDIYEGIKHQGRANGVRFWCAIAHTEHGNILGKSADGVCMYSYAGKEIVAKNFTIFKGQSLAKTP